MLVVPFEFVSSGPLVEFERLFFMILLSDGPHVCNPVLVYINSGDGVISHYVLWHCSPSLFLVACQH